jgi:hypothetical protein
MHVKFSFDVIDLEFWILYLNKGSVGSSAAQKSVSGFSGGYSDLQSLARPFPSRQLGTRTTRRAGATSAAAWCVPGLQFQTQAAWLPCGCWQDSVRKKISRGLLASGSSLSASRPGFESCLLLSVMWGGSLPLLSRFFRRSGASSSTSCDLSVLSWRPHHHSNDRAVDPTITRLGSSPAVMADRCVMIRDSSYSLRVGKGIRFEFVWSQLF